MRRLLPKSKIARSVTVLVGGTAGAQILLVLAAPLLTRLYSPESFGLLAVYASFLALIGVVSSLRYELSIPLPEDDVEAANIAVLCLMLVGISTLCTGALIFFFGSPIAELLDLPILEDYFWLMPIGVLLSGVFQVFIYWGIRTKRFSTIASTRLRQTITTLVIQLTAFKLGGIALLFGQVGGQGIGTNSLAGPALKTEAFKKISAEGIKAAVIRYRRFPLFLTWDGLLNTAGTQLPPVLFAALFGPIAAGLYSFASRVLSLPASLLGDAVGQVFFGNAADAYRTGQHGPLVSQLRSKLIKIGMPPTLILILLAPEMFAFSFGNDWRQAGEFARWMAPWLFFGFVYSPLSTLFAVIERQKQVLIIQIILLATRIIAIGLGAWIGDALSAIMFFSCASAVCYMVAIFWLAYMVGNSIKLVFQHLITAGVISSIISTPIIISTHLSNTHSNALAFGLLFSSIFLGGYYWRLLRQVY